ncbi:hypothetical protein ZWY2020_057637 [Hordeum vulgare]|nr:hypothetical protein ZWY2020_057637 [Hordeum vulgare]
MVGWRATGARAILSRPGGKPTTGDELELPRRQYTNLLRTHTSTSRGIPVNFHQLIQNDGISTTRNLLAGDNDMVPISSPLTSPLEDAEETNKRGEGVKRLKVQAIKKDIKQSPKKVNLVAKLVRGMPVIHSARANTAHNHGLDSDKLIVAEAFVGKGLYLKRLSYHAKGRCSVRKRPRCRLTVMVREATTEEEEKIDKLRVSN